MSAVSRRSRGEPGREVALRVEHRREQRLADREEDEDAAAARRSTTTIVATVGSPSNTPRRAIARAKHDGERDERDRRAEAERRALRARRRSPAPNAQATASAGRDRARADGRTRRASAADQRGRAHAAASSRPHSDARRDSAARSADGVPPATAQGKREQRDQPRQRRSYDRRAVARRRHEDAARGGVPLRRRAAPVPSSIRPAGA